MSNDQSRPARKVIPYKKGGQRRSPFSDLALQFSGTALDIAIQQRELDTSAEERDAEQPESAAASSQDSLPEPSSDTHSVEIAPPPESSQPPTIVEAPEPQVQSVIDTETRQKTPEKRSIRPAQLKNRVPAPAAGSPLKSFVSRWEPFLTETQIGICTYIYNNSTAIGQEYCFTSTAKLMAAVSKTERQIKTVLSQLTDWGLLIKGETVVNAPREQRGTFYKLADQNLDQPTR